MYYIDYPPGIIYNTKHKQGPHFYKEMISKTQRPYRDTIARITISLIAAHFIVSFGVDKSIFEFLLLGDYYRSLAGSALIAFALFSLVRLVTIRLDKKFDWFERPLERALMQLLIGVGLIAIVAFLLATFYFISYGINILKTVYLKYDFPVIVLFIVLLNLYYFAYYLVYYIKQKNSVEQKVYTKVIVVNKGTDNLPVKTDDISYFFHEGNYNFVRLKDGTDYLFSQALDEMETLLDPAQFFRVNRQMFASFSSCKAFQAVEHGKLELKLEPFYKEKVIISQKRAAAFKSWLEGKRIPR